MKWSECFITSKSCRGNTMEAVFINILGMVMITAVLFLVAALVITVPYFVIGMLVVVGLGYVVTKLADKDEEEK